VYPELFQIGDFGLRSYGAAMALAFLVAIVLGARAARRQAVGVGNWLDLCFGLLVSSIVGSRLLFVLVNAPTYVQQCFYGPGAGAQRTATRLLVDCTRALHVWEGGLVYFGGLLAATGFALYFCRRRELSFLKVADLAIPLVALGHAIGRLGCFAAGCCYGRACSTAVGVRFPPQSLVYQELQQRGIVAAGAPLTPPLHPTQLYEVAVELCLFFFLSWYSSRRRRCHGQTLALYALLYAPARMLIELLRADPARKYLLELQTPALNALIGLPPEVPLLISTSQAIGLAVFAGALVLWSRLARSEAPR
jgi:phosphatidylglycerol:prolipoprotein diacylglycerol transferase